MKIIVKDREYEYPENTRLEDIARDFEHLYNGIIVAAKVNNELRDLNCTISEDSVVEFVDTTVEEGTRIYRRSLTFVFIKAVKELLPGATVTIEHSLGKGLYCEIHGYSINNKIVASIKDKMKEIIDKNLKIERKMLPREEAIRLFEKEGLMEKVRLFKDTDKEKVPVYYCDGTVDFFYSPCVPSTGYLKVFDIRFYFPGVILIAPDIYNPRSLPVFVDVPKLASIFKEAEEWAHILDINYVASLNDLIKRGGARDLILVSEAFHEKKISKIADYIASNKMIKVVLIAGPSSSGKTSFIHRLSVQLRVNGLKPFAISLDNYFVPRELTPRDEFGNYDFESIDALDLPLFNEHLIKLIQGEEVEIPIFNFKTGEREPVGRKVKLEKNQIILMEGIHGLNEKLTIQIPKDNKYKIYVSAITQLNLDEHNRIPTSQTRLIRRIVRDSQFRSTDAAETINMWPRVRKGEERWIFPYQEQADVMFNSFLPYELPVLKKYAEPLLKKVSKDDPAYSIAKEMLEFLSYFYPIEDELAIPPNSIIREFIGGSCLDV
ncbi:uridine kinase [Caldanaerobacter subterraneus subsp. tengcongensis MB4]|jgi:uridine kinase|uniref:Uridine kinase n=1 Tax=Caldanaerobacter subterraneus subsp. tengcongensis (strain DSM 15242 / JCM 11007 / NBRC 100824 / MB4) TaxID=273068 RepID=Q8R948_CALS4|nr:nucleoside kinase [Caldanaerobacter subterraneus]AAM24972.1 Uridine kinase [Caldanaerobacter subterraneus subsp. tengcongensis MB4]MCS3915449.1 uridine kinase [Caldanaerobacter subterraneus subsp. tengcongensis MB4]